MNLSEVTNENAADEFLKVNIIINQDDPNYIQPLEKDVKEIFNPKKNKAFRSGEVIRWILKNETGELIGRIAAFTNKKYKSKGDEGPVGGIGFFECINSQPAADILFDVAKHWLLSKGMTAMDGPINFGERDRWWGLLVEGFVPPVYMLNYNPPYYKALFENYGFKLFFEQICFGRMVDKPLEDKFFERHAKLAEDPAYQARYIDKKKLPEFARDFATVYNEAWAGHGGLKQLNKDLVLKMFQQMKPVMDEKVIWFTYYNDRPIAIWVNLPDLNQWFKHLHGRFDLFAKLKFLWVKATKPCKKFTGIVFGVVPDFQGKGVDSFMVVEGAKIIQHQLSYTEYEMQWIGDFNPKMINIAQTIADKETRKLITYRYLFDQSREFKRHPILN
ncbi:MAG: hypothetical protein H0V30_09470 [Chitinophagaceae bacterium]|jgi:hypothetical protein|nr:hypothetical protein [Chitinophagaceae bacterium]